MKKIFLICALCFVLCAAAYTSNDLSNAQYLANNSIIKSQKSPALYRMDDFVLRQEVIGMALKMKGIPLPENYSCKKYFTDVTANDWVCRAVELAADNGIISRENKQFRPMDRVTRAEALAILLKTGKVSLSEPRRVVQADGTIWSLFQDLKSLGFTQWQADMLDSLPGCSLINHGNSCEDGASTNRVFAQFQPNTSALRSSVFEFAALMMGFQAGDELGPILDDFGIFVNDIPQTMRTSANTLSSDALKTLLIGEPIDTISKNPQVALVVFSDLECPFCARFENEVLSPIRTDESLQTLFVYKHFPLSFHKNAYHWALESECVRKYLGNEAFFEYLHMRYLMPDLSVYEGVADFTETQMKACLEDEGLSQSISNDQALGMNTYNISGTPTTLVINMNTHYYETVVGAQTRDFVESVIQTVKDHQ